MHPPDGDAGGNPIVGLKYSPTKKPESVIEYSISRQVDRTIQANMRHRQQFSRFSLALSVFLLALLTIAATSLAQAAYVTDDLEVTLRTGTSTKHGIVRVLPTGTKVTVLENDTDSGYSRVRTDNGAEGWILTRYLVDNPPPKVRLGSVEAQLKETRQQLQAAQEKLKETNSKAANLDETRDQLAQENNKLKRDLEEIRQASANTLKIADENRRLNRRVAEMENEAMLLRQDNATLKDRSRRDWFVVGAVVVIGSMLLGILLTRIRWRKRSGWGDL